MHRLLMVNLLESAQLFSRIFPHNYRCLMASGDGWNSLVIF